MKRFGSRSRASARLAAATPGGTSPELVGLDFKHRPRSRRARSRVVLPALAVAVAAALLLAALRVSILRVRYELAAALTSETELLERQRALTVTVRELRHPARLHRLAAERGLVRPDRVIELPAPAHRP